MDECIAVFTRDSAEAIKKAHGSAAWQFNIDRARACKFLICYRNAPGSSEHRQAFLVAHISGLRPDPTSGSSRYVVEISDWSDVEGEHLWPGGQRPARYASSLKEALGVPEEEIDFQPLGEKTLDLSYNDQPGAAPRGVDVAEAKRLLAAFYKVSEADISISISIKA